jgi:DNA-binding HxlR family transcriptional regulator
MKMKQRRSDCPVNFALESFGDKWSFLIVRDIIFYGKKTYGEFLQSEEHIATNILADRLTSLEKEGILSKAPHPTDKRKDIFKLSEKGIALIPMILEMVVWSVTYDEKTDKIIKNLATYYLQNKEKMIKEIMEIVHKNGSVFTSDESVPHLFMVINGKLVVA